MNRFVSLLLIPCLLFIGCPTVSVKEHSTGGAPPMVSVKAYWEDAHGEKQLVGGLQCQLVRKAEGAEPELVAEGTTSVDEQLVFADLEPGHYRFIVRGGEVEKSTQGFDVSRGKRASLRIDVSGGIGETVQDVAGAIAEGAVVVAVVVGATVAVVTLVGIVVVLAVLTDDEDDEDGDDDDDDDC